MLLTVDEIEVARFGATAAVLHAFLERLDCQEGVPMPAFEEEASICVGIYGEVFSRAVKKLANAGFVLISDGMIYNSVAIEED